MRESGQYETKLVVDALHLDGIRMALRLSAEAFLEAYPPRQVNTLYLDTLDAQCLSANLAGVDDRVKLRYRWYGSNLRHPCGQLELKRKVNRLRWKAISPVEHTFDLTAGSWPAFVHELTELAPAEWRPWLAAYQRPALLVTYSREYLESRDHQMRLTVDQRLAFYEQWLAPTPNLTAPAPYRQVAVIECKASVSHERRIADLLASLPARASRNSKYMLGNAAALSFL